MNEYVDEELPLEDQIYASDVESIKLEKDYDMLYRLKDHVLQNMIKDYIRDGGLKISKTAAEREVVASTEWKSYMEDMNNAKEAYRLMKAKSEYMRMIYFSRKDERKAEMKAYGYAESTKGYN